MGTETSARGSQGLSKGKGIGYEKGKVINSHHGQIPCLQIHLPAQLHFVSPRSILKVHLLVFIDVHRAVNNFSPTPTLPAEVEDSSAPSFRFNSQTVNMGPVGSLLRGATLKNNFFSVPFLGDFAVENGLQVFLRASGLRCASCRKYTC